MTLRGYLQRNSSRRFFTASTITAGCPVKSIANIAQSFSSDTYAATSSGVSTEHDPFASACRT